MERSRARQQKFDSTKKGIRKREGGRRVRHETRPKGEWGVQRVGGDRNKYKGPRNPHSLISEMTPPEITPDMATATPEAMPDPAQGARGDQDRQAHGVG